jgi:hypothetical protein
MSSDTLSKIGINDFVKLSIFKGCGFESWISEDQIRRSKLLFFFNFFSEDQNILHLLSEDRKSSFSEDQKQIFFFIYLLKNTSCNLVIKVEKSLYLLKYMTPDLLKFYPTTISLSKVRT